ncbi:MAG: hypothetical protein H0S80_10625 [Desulfovibrionaceae bacterium]|nr:hypothetical protein [Desulfovibrionaceae bacterium]
MKAGYRPCGNCNP